MAIMAGEIVKKKGHVHIVGISVCIAIMENCMKVSQKVKKTTTSCSTSTSGQHRKEIPACAFIVHECSQ
jgi:hypothetical protein